MTKVLKFDSGTRPDVVEIVEWRNRFRWESTMTLNTRRFWGAEFPGLLRQKHGDPKWTTRMDTFLQLERKKLNLNTKFEWLSTSADVLRIWKTRSTNGVRRREKSRFCRFIFSCDSSLKVCWYDKRFTCLGERIWAEICPILVSCFPVSDYLCLSFYVAIFSPYFIVSQDWRLNCYPWHIYTHLYFSLVGQHFRLYCFFSGFIHKRAILFWVSTLKSGFTFFKELSLLPCSLKVICLPL